MTVSFTNETKTSATFSNETKGSVVVFSTENKGGESWLYEENDLSYEESDLYYNTYGLTTSFTNEAK